MLGLSKIKNVHQKLVIILTLVVTVAMILASALFIWHSNQMSRLELEHDIQTLTTLSSKGLSTPLWHYDDETISAVVDALFQSPDLLYAKVTMNGNTIQEKLKAGHSMEEISVAHARELTRTALILYLGNEIGEITLALSQDRIRRQVTRNSIWAMISLLVVVVTVAVTVYLLNRAYVFSPVKALETSARKISEGRLDTPIVMNRDDEFGRLSSTLNLMIQRLKTITANRDALNHEIAERKKTEQQLMETLSLLNTAEKIGLSGSWSHDLATGEIAWSEGEYRLMSLPRDHQPDPNTRLAAIHPEDRHPYETQLQTFLNSKRTHFEQEFRIITRDDAIRFIRTEAEIVRNGSGYAVLLRGTDTDITDQKEAEAVVEKQVTSLLQAEEISKLGYFERNWQTNEAYWSRGVFSLLGMADEPHSLSHDRLVSAIHPEDRKAFRQQLEDSLARKTRIDHQYRLQAQNGRIGHIRYLADHVYDKEGSPLRTCGIIQDISEMIEAENLLRELNIRFSLALEAAGLGVWEINLTTGRLFFDRTMHVLYGYDDASFTSAIDDWKQRLHPDDREEAIASVLGRAGQTRSPSETGFRIQLPDGTIRHLSSRSVCIRDDNGTPVRLIGINQDLTGQREAQMEFTRLATAIDQVAESVIITSPEGRITYVNPAFEAVSGYTQAEVIGKDPTVLKSGRHSPEFYTHLWETLLSKKTWKGRLQNRRKNGQLYFEDATISPILDKKGKIINFVAVKRDITREIETEQQLQQAQKMESIGTLAGGIAHDFNNILTFIIGFAELALRDAEKNSILEDDIQEILIAGMRAKDLVMQILTFARQSEERQHPVSVSAMAKEVIRFIRASIPATVEIRQSITSKAKVVADPSHLHQIFMNLFTNAAQAMETEGGVLTLSIDRISPKASSETEIRLSEDTDWLRVKVADTGTGIAQEHLDQIFEPYFSTKPMGEGTGLGLSVVYGAVKQMGGHIMVQSRLGKGTEFRFFLPISTDREIQAEESQTAPTILGHETIMVVDDEPPVTKLSARMLAQQGYTVIEKNNPLDALDHFMRHAQDIDLVITDMTMPRMTGDRLAEELLKIRPDLPVICSTGFSKRMTRDVAERIGIRTILTKPLRKSTLLNAVQGALAGETSGTPS